MTTSTVFIFHGVGGHSQENWFPWLKKELETQDCRVIIPDFPHADHPTLDEWLDHFRQYERQLDERTIFVGHSLGSAFALRLLERMRQPIHACILTAPVWGVMGNDFDPIMKTFTKQPYDWPVIRRNARRFTVIHGDNDPYIRLSLAEELARNLGTTVEIIPSGGHLNTTAGFAEFPLLLEHITALR